MNLDSMSFFRLASEKMQWLSARQRVISENVANADTPEYKARDVSSFEDMLSSKAGRGDDREAHFSDEIAAGIRVQEDETAWEGSLDGNTVVLEQQTIMAADTADNYKMAANLYRKGYELLTLSATGDI